MADPRVHSAIADRLENLHQSVSACCHNLTPQDVEAAIGYLYHKCDHTTTIVDINDNAHLLAVIGRHTVELLSLILYKEHDSVTNGDLSKLLDELIQRLLKKEPVDANAS